MGTGHEAVGKAQQTGEVDRVSEVPPSGVPPPSASAQPGESILQKKGQPIPRLPEPPAANDGAGSPMEISALKAIDLDDMIQRLLDAAYAGKVTKTVCLKNAEIFAICSAAREVFLSQPALLELAPPVKIVGDIHGQYTDLIRMFEMCGFPQLKLPIPGRLRRSRQAKLGDNPTADVLQAQVPRELLSPPR